MNISRQNYEAILIDHFDGRLAAHEVALLKQFIDQHPDLGKWEELTEALPVLEKHNVPMPEKDSLRKIEILPHGPLDETNYENWFISFHEGLLNAEEQLQVSDFLQMNPFLKEDFKIFGSLRLSPELMMGYPEKHKLKKAASVVVNWYRVGSIAASFLLLFTVGWWWFQTRSHTEIPVQPLLSLKPVMDNLILVDEVPKTIHMPKESGDAAEQLAALDEDIPIVPQRENLLLLPSLSLKQTATVHLRELPEQMTVEQSLESRLLIASLIEEASSDEPNVTKSPISRILQRNLEEVAQIVAPVQALAQMESRPVLSTSGFSFWNLAQLGLNTYNTLADKDLKLVRAKHEDGKERRILLGSDRLDFRQGL